MHPDKVAAALLRAQESSLSALDRFADAVGVARIDPGVRVRALDRHGPGGAQVGAAEIVEYICTTLADLAELAELGAVSAKKKGE